jgi:hypothetical protein
MTTLATRLTPDGILYTNGYYDEITKTWVSITPTAVYAGQFDEVFLAAGSISFAGTGNYLFGLSSVFNISAVGTAWSFETWIYPETSGAVFSIGDGTQYGQSFALDWGPGTANQFRFRQGNGTAYPVAITTTGTYPANAWYHVSVSCSAAGVRQVYVNGVLDGTATYTSAVSTATQWTVNGFYDNNGPGSNGGTSFMSNLRLVIGSNLYTQNFTPPYAPLVSVTNTQLLLCMPNNGGLFTDSSPNGFRAQSQGNLGASSSKPFTLNTVQRQINSGTLQVSGYFDEETGIS